MYEPGSVVRSQRGTVIEVLENGPDRLRIKREMPPATGKGVEHFHQNGVESFLVLEGEATGSVNGESRVLRIGDELRVEVGSAHVHPHTAPEATAVIEHTIEPCPRFAGVYFASWLTWLADGRVNAQDEPTFLSVMGVIRHGGGGTWVKGPPVLLQRALAAVLSPVAASRGYRVVEPPH